MSRASDAAIAIGGGVVVVGGIALLVALATRSVAAQPGPAPAPSPGARPTPVKVVHSRRYRFTVNADPGQQLGGVVPTTVVQVQAMLDLVNPGEFRVVAVRAATQTQLVWDADVTGGDMVIPANADVSTVEDLGPTPV